MFTPGDIFEHFSNERKKKEAEQWVSWEVKILMILGLIVASIFAAGLCVGKFLI